MAEPGINRVRVMLADDNEDGVNSLATLLTRGGYEVRTATDGMEALEVAREFHPDV